MEIQVLAAMPADNQYRNDRIAAAWGEYVSLFHGDENFAPAMKDSVETNMIKDYERLYKNMRPVLTKNKFGRLTLTGVS